jgi:hypothetical protein
MACQIVLEQRPPCIVNHKFLYNVVSWDGVKTSKISVIAASCKQCMLGSSVKEVCPVICDAMGSS